MVKADILIVGAGPAGATLARLLGTKYSVLVIDKKADKQSTFQKPCGGLLSADAQKALSRFDLTLPKEVLVDPQIFAVKTIDVKTGLVRHYQRFYVNLDRHRFDLWLMSLIPPSVTVWTGVCTAIQRAEDGFSASCRMEDGSIQTVSSHYLVGADGANSLVRRTFFGKRKIRSYVAIQQWFEETHPNPFYSCVFDSDTSDCCSWSISKDQYFIFGGAFAPKDCWNNFEKQKEKLKSFGYRFGTPIRTEGCTVLRPSSPFTFCCGGNGVFLIGEAAGFISPSSLEGFSWAIQSGTLLAEAFEKGGDLHRRYRRKTIPLRCKLVQKMLKSPFIYQPTLRYLVMKSGLRSIHMYESSGK